MHHIKNTLPEIKGKIQSGLQKYSLELQQLGDPLADNDGNFMFLWLASNVTKL